MAHLSTFRLSWNSFKHNWQAHLTVMLGIAICTMVLTGSLMVGDSVESSLVETTELRLGKTEYVISGYERYFKKDLSYRVDEDLTDISTAPLLLVNGIASADGGQKRVNSVNILGIDENFISLMSDPENITIPEKGIVYISRNLADRLEVTEGDDILFRIEKATVVPSNAPFVSDSENQIPIRVQVGKILGPEQLGRFNLKTSQTAPYNAFLSLSYLNSTMNTVERINHILFSNSTDTDDENLRKSIGKNWSTDDMSLQIRNVENSGDLELISERVFIDPVVVHAVESFAPKAEKILTYFVNSFRHDNDSTPYSFISAGNFTFGNKTLSENEIIVNTWLAEDLDLQSGDSLLITYFEIGPLRNLVEKSRWFSVKGIVPIEGRFADLNLMPDIPGLTDAGNCRDWDTSIPVDLKSIRDKDEEYWNQWQGTPKAFISFTTGKQLWENRFGSCTAIRFPGEEYSKGQLSDKLTSLLSPEDFGIYLDPIKDEGLKAARGGVDFSQLFMGLSFFLLIAGIILLALLYNLHLERRISETGTLKAIGYSKGLIRKIFILEAILIAVPGIILGGLLAVLYNKLVFIGLNTVWTEIVRTTVLREKIEILTLITGMTIGFVLVIITLYFNLNKNLRRQSTSLQRGVISRKSNNLIRWVYPAAWIFGILSIALLVSDLLKGGSLNPGLFFAAGGLLLLSLLFFSVVYIHRKREWNEKRMSLPLLARENLYRNPSRSLRIIILFSLGTFVIISTGLNQKDLYSGSEEKTSGTGGYLYFSESTMPILVDISNYNTSEDYNFDHDLSFVQMRKTKGDDASCLNLNRVSQPRILGFDPDKLSGRFSFVKTTGDIDNEDPWKSLKKELPGNIIPAIADQTVIQWGLGKKVGDTLTYWNENGNMMKLKLVAGLSNSIFQGNVLIDETIFMKHFPSSSGSHILLVGGDFNKKEQIRDELEREFRNLGMDIDLAATRLARFNEVENTYLTIFLLLGGLGMILGTIGLGISLARNLLDRRQELGMLKALGFGNGSILSLITREYLILLSTGTFIGAITAFTATLPSILSRFVNASWETASIIILIILLNGFFWIYLITRWNLKRNLITSLRSE